MGTHKMHSATRCRILPTKRSTIVLMPAYAKTQLLCAYVVTLLTACYIWINGIRSATRCIILPNLRCTTVLFSAYAKAWPVCMYVAPTKYLGFLFFRISRTNFCEASAELRRTRPQWAHIQQPSCRHLQTCTDLEHGRLGHGFRSDPTYIENHVGDILHQWHVIN
jgi:hypothetical protein